jgi:hypothetical protein
MAVRVVLECDGNNANIARSFLSCPVFWRWENGVEIERRSIDKEH